MAKRIVTVELDLDLESGEVNITWPDYPDPGVFFRKALGGDPKAAAVAALIIALMHPKSPLSRALPMAHKGTP